MIEHCQNVKFKPVRNVHYPLYHISNIQIKITLNSISENWNHKSILKF